MKTEQKIIPTLEHLRSLTKTWKNQGHTIVFTNGCFDILHLGHVDYLEKAKQLGSKLIVGLNTDRSVKKLKGHSRPVNPEYARARVLAALTFVDAVILFDDDTPLALIQDLKPDILVKGADYNLKNIVGADIVLAYGGKVETIPLVNGFSTTDIISKLAQT
ncbi:MAG: D-glycero-beta-D-manno-heptose 1-phosphate adenylyltransferase [Cytophagaceae bacterium]|nr:D-glycero-beta-D-manno-heptose 1-phosphate adenylyltransferase [Cytophagaceae bacterium]MDW8456176.1 D-glycero-beta-D-manno-heptose 1-phosphate adenylyltransferase [Cytophagaceae bacterium]